MSLVGTVVLGAPLFRASPPSRRARRDERERPRPVVGHDRPAHRLVSSLGPGGRAGSRIRGIPLVPRPPIGDAGCPTQAGTAHQRGPPPRDRERRATRRFWSPLQALLATNLPWQILLAWASCWMKTISPPSDCMSSVSKP